MVAGTILFVGGYVLRCYSGPQFLSANFFIFFFGVIILCDSSRSSVSSWVEIFTFLSTDCGKWQSVVHNMSYVNSVSLPESVILYKIFMRPLHVKTLL